MTCGPQGCISLPVVLDAGLTGRRTGQVMSDDIVPAEVRESIARYRPKSLSEAAWDGVADEARALILKVEPGSWQVAKSHLSALASLLAHTCGSGPVTMDALTPEAVEVYCEALRIKTPHGNSVATVRSRLRRLAELHRPTRLTQARRRSQEWRTLDPYSDEELRAIEGAAEVLDPADAVVLRRGLVLIEQCGLGPRVTASAWVEDGRLLDGNGGRDHGPAPSGLPVEGDVRVDAETWARLRDLVTAAVGVPLRRSRLRDRWVIRVLARPEPLAGALADLPITLSDLASYARCVAGTAVVDSDRIRRL